MSSYILIIDNREKKLISLLENAEIIQFKVVIKSLKLGDIAIISVPKEIHDTDILDNKMLTDEFIYDNLVIVFERKTCSDLLASINDGRYREQKARLISKVNLNQICYIIENPIDKILDKYRKYGSNVVRGAIINKIWRDKIKILRTFSLDETATSLLTICKKVISNPEYFKSDISETGSTSEATTQDYSSTIKISKRENIVHSNYGELCLSIIPGVSIKIAKVIIGSYGCINYLVSSINISFSKYTNYDTIVKELGDISIDISGGKKRRIGKQVALRVIEMLRN